MKVGGFVIPERSLTSINFIEGTPTVTFSGMAREYEGREIALRLKNVAAKGAARYEVVDQTGVHGAGVCKLVNLRIETLSTIPRLILFSGELVLPSLRIDH